MFGTRHENKGEPVALHKGVLSHLSLILRMAGIFPQQRGRVDVDAMKPFLGKQACFYGNGLNE